MDKDYYRILGIDRGADEKDVKQAYRRLARKYHPDINPGDRNAELHFKEINEAYQVLSDPEKRKLYDRFGAGWENASRVGGAGAGPQVNFDFGNVGDFGGLFETLFGGMGRGRGAASGPARGEDLEHTVTVTFAEAYRGTTRTLNISLNEECAQCRGKGGEVRSCPDCNGSGQSRQRRGFLGAGACARCHGTGELREKMCARCAGVGTVKTQKKLEVKVPAGVREGQRIRLSNQGGGGTRGGARGDLFLLVHILEHPFFVRSGDDLTCEIPVTFPEAALGAEINVPTMTNEVKMRIPPGTQSGQVFRLAGKGMPKMRAGGNGSHGDELVKVKIVTPKNPTAREIELIRELAALRNENPRASLRK